MPPQTAGRPVQSPCDLLASVVGSVVFSMGLSTRRRRGRLPTPGRMRVLSAGAEELPTPARPAAAQSARAPAWPSSTGRLLAGRSSGGRRLASTRARARRPDLAAPPMALGGPWPRSSSCRFASGRRCLRRSCRWSRRRQLRTHRRIRVDRQWSIRPTKGRDGRLGPGSR